MEAEKAQALTGNYDVKFLGVRKPKLVKLSILSTTRWHKDVINLQVSRLPAYKDDAPDDDAKIATAVMPIGVLPQQVRLVQIFQRDPSK